MTVIGMYSHFCQCCESWTNSGWDDSHVNLLLAKCILLGTKHKHEKTLRIPQVMIEYAKGN